MSKGLNAQGFTIVETMIVLAVTAGLLISALAYISGQQTTTEFTQAVNEIKSQIDGVINNVQSGYYASASNQNFTCSESDTGPVVDTGTQARGSSQKCIFIGRAMQFAADNKPPNYNSFNIIGQQYQAGTATVNTTLSSTLPIALSYYPGSTNVLNSAADTTQSAKLGFGLKAAKMTWDGGNTSTVAFVTADNQSQYDDTGTVLNSGALVTSLYAISNISFGAANTKVAAIQALSDNSSCDGACNYSKASQVDICFEGGANRHADIVIGGNGRQLNTVLNIGNGPCV